MSVLRICWSGATTGNSVTNYTLAYSPITSSTLTYITNISSGTTCWDIIDLNHTVGYSGYVESNCTNCYKSTKLYWTT